MPSPLAPLHGHAGFSRDAALCLARISALAYDNEAAAILAGLKEMAGDDSVRDLYDVRISLIEQDAVQALVISDAWVCVVAFRGSNERKDWARNFKATPTEYDHLPYHTGFLEAYLTIRNKLANACYDHRIGEDKKAMFLTGHSQGGAIAGVESSIVWPHSVRAVYTFNAPRFGGAGVRRYIASRLKGKYFRVEFGNDFVSRIPRLFRWKKLPFIPTPRRFYDAGCHMYVTKEGEILRSPSRARLWRERFSGFRFDMYRNHLIDGLIEALRK